MKISAKNGPRNPFWAILDHFVKIDIFALQNLPSPYHNTWFDTTWTLLCFLFYTAPYLGFITHLKASSRYKETQNDLWSHLNTQKMFFVSFWSILKKWIFSHSWPICTNEDISGTFKKFREKFESSEVKI